MVLVVVFDNPAILPSAVISSGKESTPNIVAFEGFDEALRYTIRLGVLDGGVAGNEIERGGEVARLPGSAGAAIVSQLIGAAPGDLKARNLVSTTLRESDDLMLKRIRRR